ncbi:hypothetical protein [Paenibacillus sp. Marseille-Q9583]
MTQLCLPGNAKTTQVLEGVGFSAGAIYNGKGTMKNMGDQEMTAVGAYMQEGYLSLSMGGIGGNNFQAVNDGTQLTYADPVHVSAKNIIMGVEMLGLDGTATSDATATAADIAVGKIAYSQGVKLTGTNNASPPIVDSVYPCYKNTVYNYPPAILAAINNLGLWQSLYIQLTESYFGSSPDFIVFVKTTTGVAPLSFITNQATWLTILSASTFQRTSAAGLNNNRVSFRAYLINGSA